MNRIKLFLIFGTLIINSFLGLSQKEAANEDVSDCFGAIQMTTNIMLQPNLLGRAGVENDLKAYSDEFRFPESNSLWFKFEANHSGWLSVAIEKTGFPIEYGIFILNESETCTDIHSGKTEVFIHQLIDESQLSKTIDSIQYFKNQLIFLFINTTISGNRQVALQATFNQDVDEEEFNSMKKSFDFRKSMLDDSFTVMIRDAKTKLPIVANVIVTDSKTLNALYSASDMVFPYSENLKMTLKIDANGYFFQDVFVNIKKDKQKEQYVYLEGLEQDQLIELEGLVFQPHTAYLLPEAMPKLKRLKDFMIINKEVNVEIQGHVHFEGKNSFKGQRLSKKRAKSVRKSLVEGGIDKKRITVVGYGNSKMKYPDAKTDAEIQANRRVEIKIK